VIGKSNLFCILIFLLYNIYVADLQKQK